MKGGLEGGQTQGRWVKDKNLPSSMTIISRLGLLNQQMAGLASSLAGKTGTFQVFILPFLGQFAESNP